MSVKFKNARIFYHQRAVQMLLAYFSSLLLLLLQKEHFYDYTSLALRLCIMPPAYFYRIDASKI
jgi:hypothetical protein